MPENPSVYGYHSPKAGAFSTEFLPDTRNGIKCEKTGTMVYRLYALAGSGKGTGGGGMAAYVIVEDGKT
jgi:hypothetical protein